MAHVKGWEAWSPLEMLEGLDYLLNQDLPSCILPVGLFFLNTWGSSGHL